MSDDKLVIAGIEFNSRLWVGTGKYKDFGDKYHHNLTVFFVSCIIIICGMIELILLKTSMVAIHRRPHSHQGNSS